jgi:peptide/nickel transport system ATP-binding protein
MISLRDLRVHFPRRRSPSEVLRREPRTLIRAVDGIDLDLADGEIVALVGESGSGKTTTGRALVRLAPISGGAVLHDGRDVTAIRGRDLRAYRQRVQIVFQDPYESLDPRRSVGDQVREPLIVTGQAAGVEREQAVVRALEDAGLRPASAYLERFREGSASAWPSPAPWSSSPLCWWRTSRSPCWTSHSEAASCV